MVSTILLVSYVAMASKIQQDWVQDSIEHIDSLGNALQHHETILQHKYMSYYSGAVVHLDGNHKLHKWEFVIHGMIDGHDHVVSLCYLYKHNFYL